MTAITPTSQGCYKVDLKTGPEESPEVVPSIQQTFSKFSLFPKPKVGGGGDELTFQVNNFTSPIPVIY